MQIVTVSLYDLQMMLDRNAEKVIQAFWNKQSEIPQSQQDQLLNIQQAAAFLTLSVSTVYTLVSKCSIPVSKKGKRLYFSEKELSEWIKSGKKKTVSDINYQTDAYLQKKGGN